MARVRIYGWRHGDALVESARWGLVSWTEWCERTLERIDACAKPRMVFDDDTNTMISIEIEMEKAEQAELAR